MLQEIAKYIENASIGFTIGVNLHVGELDQGAPENCIAVLDDLGGETNFYLPDKKTATLHFLSRHQNKDTARGDIYLIHGLFHGRAQFELPIVTAGEHYVVNWADAETPQQIDKDEKELPMYSLNIEFDIKDFDT
jgi:hypothetical protein